MLSKTNPLPDWIVKDVNPDHAPQSCFAICVGSARYVPGNCEYCDDTVVDLATRAEDNTHGDCARCGEAGAFVFYDGCRDSFTMLRLVALAMFGEEPEETLECSECGLVLELQYFKCDGEDICAWCMSASELERLRTFVARAEAGKSRCMPFEFDRAEDRIIELVAELEFRPVRQ
jgi:hypothetical protein